jgi:HEPN domain-containing protein
MDLFIVLLGLIIGILLISGKSKPARERTERSTFKSPASPPPVRQLSPRPPTPVLPPLDQRNFNEGFSTKTILETWRKSIVGLINLAQGNLKYARQCLETGDHKTAVEAALTSIENVARALLHSYGEKPEVGSGQEEALKLLGRRFRGTESADFEKAIQELTLLYCNRIVRKCLQKSNPCFSLLPTKAGSSAIFESASRIVAAFTQIIETHFATEIPELGEACPKCHALDVEVLAFDVTTVSYTCKNCRHSWIQPRAF